MTPEENRKSKAEKAKILYHSNPESKRKALNRAAKHHLKRLEKERLHGPPVFDDAPRQCRKCLNTKLISLFYRQKGYSHSHVCISCDRRRRVESDWRRKSLRESPRKTSQNRLATLRAQYAIRKHDPIYRETLRQTRIKYRATQKAKRTTRQYAKKRRQILRHHIKGLLDNRLKKILKQSHGKKAYSMKILIGCTPACLVKYLESLWLPGMTWENHGIWRIGEPMTWHIDHIKPCASFDLTDPEQQRACFHHTNLQPLWAIDNIRKGDFIAPPTQTA